LSYIHEILATWSAAVRRDLQKASIVQSAWVIMPVKQYLRSKMLLDLNSVEVDPASVNSAREYLVTYPNSPKILGINQN